MKTLICLFISILLSTIICGQENKLKSDSKLMIGLHCSPGISYRYLTSNGEMIPNSIIASRDEQEIVKFGYSAGFSGIFQFNRMLGLEFGMQYSNLGYQSRKIVFFSGTGATNMSAVMTHFDFKYTYHYMGIPLMLNTLFGKGKVRFLLSAGVVTNVLVGGTLTSRLHYLDGSVDKNRSNFVKDDPITEYNRINFMPVVNIGVNYDINEKLLVRIAPTFSYGVRSVANTPISEYLWNCGVNAGCYIKL